MREKDLTPWQRAVINLGAELLPWERELLLWDMSYCLRRGVNILGEKELLSRRKDELRSWEKGLLPKRGVTTLKRKSCYTHREELLPWQSFYTGRKDELLSWESYCSERGVNTPRKELLPRVTTSRGVTILVEELLEERISYFPEKELLLWERSYFPEGVTLRERWSIGVTTLI